MVQKNMHDSEWRLIRKSLKRLSREHPNTTEVDVVKMLRDESRRNKTLQDAMRVTGFEAAWRGLM